MKLLIVMAVALALNSCNTCIGLGRDTVQGYNWTKAKIQGTQSDDSAGAPVY
jgi:predicted small secreted protein